MDELIFRLASPADRTPILEIAAQTWEGDDYIPDVIDEWLSSEAASLVVAESDGVVVGVARYDRTFPRYAWFEGLRVDPAYTGRGIAKAITGHLLELARADQVERIGLSTYMDNYASQKVSAAFGFSKVIGFAACSAGAKDAQHFAARSERVEVVPVAETIAIVRESEALSAGAGFLPHSWRFCPFARGPELAIGHMTHRLGIREDGRLAALLCIGDHTPHGPASFSLDFLEGEPEALTEVVRHGLSLITGEKYVEAMIPCRDGVALPTLDVLKAVGFEPWNGGREDVLVFERAG
jgi:GNAT superfamily N-acetyltransferase